MVGATDTTSCDNTSDCTQPTGTRVDGDDIACMLVTAGGIAGANSTGFCGLATWCVTGTNTPIQGDTLLSFSANVYSYICNENTDADLMALDVSDAFYWDYWMQGGSSDVKSVTRAACTTDADCTNGADACGSVTLDTVTSTYCVPMDGWCAVADMDTADPPVATGSYSLGSGWTVPNSLNKFTVDCSGSERGVTQFWQSNNDVEQTDAAGCATVEPECTTITWDGSSSVAAFCGTATMEANSYSQLGCYPTADCETLGGSIPGSDDIKYELLCGATQLAASAVAAVIVAASL